MTTRLSLLAVALAAPLAASAQSRYTEESGFDRPGEAYETFEQTTSYQSHELCHDACESQPRCRSYTFVRAAKDGGNATCRLRETVPAPVEDACCISAVKGGKPAQKAVPSFTVQWLGRDGDRLGAGALAPDGAPDHRLRLVLQRQPTERVVAITLGHTNDIRWSTRPGAGEALVVVGNGQQADGATLALPGDAVVDLYAHDIGQWGVHAALNAQIELDGGRRIAHAYEIAAPPDRLLGIWQMHCPSHSPDAFEPMTTSGRILIELRADGTLAGWFGSLPLSGRIDESGRISGTARSAEAEVEWNGELTARERGRPLAGSGGFRFLRAGPDACVDSGMWSSE